MEQPEGTDGQNYLFLSIRVKKDNIKAISSDCRELNQLLQTSRSFHSVRNPPKMLLSQT